LRTAPIRRLTRRPPACHWPYQDLDGVLRVGFVELDCLLEIGDLGLELLDPTREMLQRLDPSIAAL
jgi:hypothetical protein